MYLVDANILIYAADPRSARDERARDWLDERLTGQPETIGLPWVSLLAFVRIVTNSRIYSPAASAGAAWGLVEEWLDQPASWIPHPGPRHRYFLAQLIHEVNPSSQLIPDTHLAALAMEHGLTMASADSDFARFAGLRWLNPLD